MWPTANSPLADAANKFMDDLILIGQGKDPGLDHHPLNGRNHHDGKNSI
jgi:hypothetical protein